VVRLTRRERREAYLSHGHPSGDSAFDADAALQNLRAEPGGEIRVWGSTKLIRTLAEHDLVDEYRLAVYPLVLGTGKKLFSDGFALARLTLVATRALRSGVLANIYRRSEAS
jgi:dihydrofolate reductase